MKTFSSHKGVAPIIATLLMVAIAVVGGVLIYVYTQGFFASTSTTGISTDVLTITGYDLANGNLLYNGATAGTADVLLTNGKIAGDQIAIHVKNTGGSTVEVSGIKVDGVGAARVGAAPAAGQWALYTPTVVAVDPVKPLVGSLDEATILYGVSVAILKDAVVTVEVTTATGGTFSFKVTEGLRK